MLVLDVLLVVVRVVLDRVIVVVVKMMSMTMTMMSKILNHLVESSGWLQVKQRKQCR